jgi:glycerophosphoryl diester phosphodiesterase
MRFHSWGFAMPARFELQGHRGARGLKPENTLPSFEVAFDLGVTSVETDVHLTRDAMPVLYHDPALSERICRVIPGKGVPDPARRPAIRSLTLAELRGYRADRNPDPVRFLEQDASVTPLARLFAEQQGIDPFTPPTLMELFAFAGAYQGELGTRAGKTSVQQAAVRRARFDLELKRVPFHPEFVDDVFDGTAAGVLEEVLLACVRAADLDGRTAVRSFDHRSVQVLRRLAPGLTAAVLIAETAPVSPASLVRQADAVVYCPEYRFLDEALVRQCHAQGVRVVPWTVNQPAEWRRLLDWGVDGITTDFPDQLGRLLRERGINY